MPYVQRMNWEAIRKAYPSQEQTILSIKSLRDRIDQAMADVDLPVISTAVSETDDLALFASLLARPCIKVWIEMKGSEPDFDMEKALMAATTGDPVDMGTADEELFHAISQNAFSRLFHLLREKNPGLLPETWSRGDCPFCGTCSRIGFDAEDKRTLHCLTCGHSWRFPRLRCTSCGNNDFTTQGYFEAEGIEGARVYFCRECGHYIKIVDTRTRNAEDPETEDTLTLELDDLAEKEGFK